MAESFLPPVIIEILATIRDFQAKKKAVVGGLEEIQVAGDTTSARFGALGKRMANWALMAGAATAAYATKLAYDYNGALDEMARQTTMTNAQVQALSPTMLQVSRDTATSSSDIVKAYTQAIKSGLDLTQAHEAVTSAAQFAKAMHGNLTDTMTNALAVQKMHIAGTSSVTQTLDIFTNAIQNSKLTADTLNSSLGGKALSVFSAYGIDIKTATTMLAGFANQNLYGNRAILSMTSLFSTLSKPSITAKGALTGTAIALKSIGLNQDTLARQMKRPGGVLTVLKEINDAFNANATAVQKAGGITGFMNTLFGARGGTVYSNLIAQLPQLTSLFGKLNTAGATQGAFQEWLKSPQGAFQNFLTTIQDALIPMGNWLLPKITSLVIGTVDVIKFISGHPLLGGILGTLVTALLGGMAASKIASLGVGMAEMFGATVSATVAPMFAAAVATAIVGLGIGNLITKLLPTSWKDSIASFFGVHVRNPFTNPGFLSLAPWEQQLYHKMGYDPTLASTSLTPSALLYEEYKYGIGPTSDYARRGKETFAQWEKRLHLTATIK